MKVKDVAEEVKSELSLTFLFMFSPAATAANEIAIIVLPVPISALITPAG
jgi:hypothetical protein